MPEQLRPDPDELLQRINRQEKAEEQSSRGKLKIFFGACAGVGKTYTMLSAAQTAFRDGLDVIIGIVETHGRSETATMAEGLPHLPTRKMEYRGTELEEFDLDTALEKKPQLILLDELAHTNAHGSRHPKRWQDVEELLEAGIDVYTTLNVQHLESLNDIVARITGVWVKETIPDAFFDSADEISLVDIPSEELLKRLEEGKVYIAPGAKQRAAQNFFKKQNLIALRELALRRTAERVDALMDTYKSNTGSTEGWSGADRILVCIGPDNLSTKLVRVAKRTASGLKAPWTAVYIENERHYRMNKEHQSLVERTLALAERMGGKAEILHGNKAAEEIIQYARANGITKIIVGKRGKARWKEIVYGALADQLIRRSGDIDIYVVTGDVAEQVKLKSPFSVQADNVDFYISAPIASGLCTLLLYAMQSWTTPLISMMLFLVAVVLVSVQYGVWPSVLTTLLSVTSFTYFFLEPVYSFKVTDTHYLVAFSLLLVTGVAIAAQTSRLRLRIIFARKREHNTSVLYAMTRELTATRGKKKIASIVARHVGELMHSDICVWLPIDEEKLTCVFNETDLPSGDPAWVKEESAINWAFSHKQRAGMDTATLPSARGLYMPLIASETVGGVIGLFPHEADMHFTSEQLSLLETFASLAASALERAQAAELVEKTMLETEGEKLRNILLSSVSHDLRTPLASITGAASTLLLENQKISNEYRDELLRLIHEEAARLAKIVTNLLDVTSLESGSVKLNKELYFIEELIGSALMRTESRLEGRRVVTRIEPGLPLVRMDGLLIEQVLINLLENIADHTPAHTNINISVRMEKPDIILCVEDDGPGIPQGEEERIFDKFYRSAHADAEHVRGGLGLAICRGIVIAHDGVIWAENRDEGGARVLLSLPIKAV